MSEDDDSKEIQNTGIAYAAAVSLFVSVVVFLGLGWLLDRWLGTKPWLMAAGIVLGTIIGLYEFVRTTSKVS